MVLDTAGIRLLSKERNYERYENKARINLPLAVHTSLSSKLR